MKSTLAHRAVSDLRDIGYHLVLPSGRSASSIKIWFSIGSVNSPSTLAYSFAEFSVNQRRSSG